ncbi:aromatic ring-hydroxylating dioxygenase subunit alpha [Burkholderia sp. TSV86]|uniref:aromatic ring-hydroxylating dioxygenase subunit alpha n=1 Tax=Burkholderia sp. TSV86 TaxID=1385594 RepID=UPI00075CD6C0|nr:aromatic ring-hydroxylating dioxygenase subunit alpha [Burkholderia sp. TSV86]KVE37884.1 (2Fe-2S)-binding protein [Burkholderia sp. TSV86]
MFIRNAWYVAALSAEITHALFARTLLGDPVVLFRRSDGEVTALDDRCAHRQVPLSMGRLKGDEIECGYHGLRFDGTGQCVHIPSQATIPTRACVKHYPARERHGFVWLWMGDPALLDEAAIPDHSICASPEFAGQVQYIHIGTDYRLGVDNLLDLSHIAFVHQSTIGSDAIATTPPVFTSNDHEVRVSRTTHGERNSPLLHKLMQLEFIDRTQEMVFWPVGNVRIETIARPPGGAQGPAFRLYTTTIFTPETEKSCHAFLGLHRDFLIDNAELTEMAGKQIYSTIQEDKVVTEAQQNNWRDDAPIVHLVVDQPSFVARAMLDRLVAAEQRVDVAQAK